MSTRHRQIKRSNENTQKSIQKTCHGCGLEDADKPDYPALDKFPCSHCIRNKMWKGWKPQLVMGGEIKDRWNECWTLNTDNKPFIER